MSLQASILHKLKSNDYSIFYSSTCGYSQSALDLLKSQGISFKGYDVNKNRFTFEEVIKIFNQLHAENKIQNWNPSHKTKPAIFKGTYFIGGYNELSSYLL